MRVRRVSLGSACIDHLCDQPSRAQPSPNMTVSLRHSTCDRVRVHVRVCLCVCARWRYPASHNRSFVLWRRKHAFDVKPWIAGFVSFASAPTASALSVCVCTKYPGVNFQSHTCTHAHKRTNELTHFARSLARSLWGPNAKKFGLQNDVQSVGKRLVKFSGGGVKPSPRISPPDRLAL